MSYSFTARAVNKIEALTAVHHELEKVVQAQPIHATDKEQALVAAAAFVNLLAEDTSRDISVAVNGSIYQTDTGVQSATVSVSASIIEKA